MLNGKSPVTITEAYQDITDLFALIRSQKFSSPLLDPLPHTVVKAVAENWLTTQELRYLLNRYLKRESGKDLQQPVPPGTFDPIGGCSTLSGVCNDCKEHRGVRRSLIRNYATLIFRIALSRLNPKHCLTEGWRQIAEQSNSLSRTQ
ncbi:hypothetical protein NPIL_117431 [Nephila pilipes]|uniref:Uncharacterized protein n=1 Tax=Nephila pilipes TaxID=299642 RepID=A0A8X6R4U6_NEPPI|nr:hypothetical protein NPIL_117431 [Nephila pilipes]